MNIIRYKEIKVKQKICVEFERKETVIMKATMNDRNDSTAVIEVKYGDIIWTIFPEGFGSVQSGKRPAVVVSNDTNNVHSPIINVCPITSSDYKKNNKDYLPIHVPISTEETGLTRDSVILCESPCSIDKRQILDKVGHIYSETLIQRLKKALAIQFNMA